MSLNLSLFPPIAYGYGPLWTGYYPRYWNPRWNYPRRHRHSRRPFGRIDRRSRGKMTSHSKAGGNDRGGGIDTNGDGVYSESEVARFLIPDAYIDWEGQEEDPDGGGSIAKTCAEIRANLAVVGRGVDIDESTLEYAGKGLFATRDFATGEAITEFAGYLLDQSDSARLAREGRDANLISHVGGIWNLDGRRRPDGALIVNAELDLKNLGGASYANDVPYAEANARFTFVDCEENHRSASELLARITTQEEMMRALPIALKPRDRITLLVATRPIKAGDEIFASWSAPTNFSRDGIVSLIQ